MQNKKKIYKNYLYNFKKKCIAHVEDIILTLYIFILILVPHREYDVSLYLLDTFGGQAAAFI